MALLVVVVCASFALETVFIAGRVEGACGAVDNRTGLAVTSRSFVVVHTRTVEQ